MRKGRFEVEGNGQVNIQCSFHQQTTSSSYSFFSYLPAKLLVKATSVVFTKITVPALPGRKNFPVRSIGRIFPSLSTKVSPGISFLTYLRIGSKSRRNATIPVPSFSRLQNRHKQLLNAFSVTFTQGKSLFIFQATNSVPFHVFSNTRNGIFLPPS